jgi:predicted nucleic acid-binding protein
MILADIGPLVALFDPTDQDHKRCIAGLRGMDKPLCTTFPALTVAFHLLDPGSIDAQRLQDFVTGQGLNVWYLGGKILAPMFELMVQYADHPMDLADASLVAPADALKLRQVFTIDRDDFSRYRIKRGHRHSTFEILSQGRYTCLTDQLAASSDATLRNKTPSTAAGKGSVTNANRNISDL